ncbi:antitoxin Xre-like helix-turn-helix domain-containing protein [Candidatus Accumulibacter sp. ACC012]|uniref:antitoxin Xre-like helix-turn-helix domain-containing protein n=1 Tax=Candidatus Accumulibacter sp. ACC012 TaxID=2823332 RepID=UPI00343A2584
MSLIRQGIPSAAVDSLATTLAISQSELATTLAILDRTLTRRKKEGTLNSEESPSCCSSSGGSSVRTR